MYTLDVLDSDVFTRLRSFIQNAIGTTIEVIQVPTNRASMPDSTPFVTMARISREQIAWPSSTLSDPATQPQSQSTTMSTMYRIQIDAYGATSGDIIQTLQTVWQAPDAFDFFNALTGAGVYPLYSETPHQSPLIDGEDQYELRWTMDLCLQYNPSITATTQTASTASVSEIINVEATYH